MAPYLRHQYPRPCAGQAGRKNGASAAQPRKLEYRRLSASWAGPFHRIGRHISRYLVQQLTGAARLFYAYSTDHGKTFSSPLNFGNFEAQPAHPYVLSLGSDVHLVWKEFDGESTGIFGMNSSDGGKSWSAPGKLASTTDVSDSPLLVGFNKTAYLSWNTRNEGYRLIEIGGMNK